MKMSNQNLRKYLRPFSIADQHRLLKGVFKKCFDLVDGNESVTTQMMGQLEKQAYVQLNSIDVINEYSIKKRNVITEVERKLEELFNSNSSLDQMDTSEMASKRQHLLINNDRISLLSGSNDKEPNFSGDNVRIKQSKTKGISEAVSSTRLSNVYPVLNENTIKLSPLSKIKKCHNIGTQKKNIEFPRLNYSEVVDLTIDADLFNGISEAASSTRLSNVYPVLNENTPKLTPLSEIEKCHNIGTQKKNIESPRLNYSEVIDLTIDDDLFNVSAEKINNNAATNMSNYCSNRNNNSSHCASAVNKCNNIVQCGKDSQKMTSKIETINKKEKTTKKRMSNNRLKRKTNSPHRPSSTNECNNIVDCKKDSQKYHYLSILMEESNINKGISLKQVYKKKSSKVVILSSVENSTDLEQNPNTSTKSIDNSTNNPIVNMNFATEITYEKLRIIIFKNYYFYNRNGLCKLAKIFTNNDLLLKSHESWLPDTVRLIETLLEDLFKSLNDFKFKSVVFMACLSVLYRRIYFSDKSEEMYSNFIEFINVIKMCTTGVDDRFWKPLLPDGWNKVFLNGCLIVDYILYSALPNSMYLHVDKDIIPNGKVLHNAYLNETQSKNMLNSAIIESEQPAIENSGIDRFSESPVMPMISDDPRISDILFVDNSLKTVMTPFDELNSASDQLERPVTIRSSSNSGFSHMKTFTSTQNNDEKNKKIKYFESMTNVNKEEVKNISSHYLIQQLHAQNMCLQTPTYSQSNKRPKKRNNLYTLFDKEVPNEPSSLLHTIIKDSSKVHDEQNYRYLPKKI